MIIILKLVMLMIPIQFFFINDTNEVDDSRDSVSTDSTEGSIPSRLISNVKMFDKNEEMCKLLIYGCMNMMGAEKRSYYMCLLDENNYNDILQKCQRMKQLEFFTV